MARACTSFQILNQFQQPVVHAFAYHPHVEFGKSGGESTVACRFPAPLLNVGAFSLRTFLSEPPDGEFYERLEGICPFEIVRTDKTILWGWRPEACAYHEHWEWKKLAAAGTER